MIEGLSHMTFVVRDLDRMERILTEVLGAKRIYDSGAEGFSLSAERFFDVAGLWIAVMQGDPLQARSYNHVAFKVSEADLPKLTEKVKALGLEVKPPRPRVEGEGQSLYFYDEDNHLFELHTGTLAQRLARYERGVSVLPPASWAG